MNVSKAVLQLQNSVSRQKQDWETPHDVFETACKEFYINPKLDVCAYKANKKCEKYFNPHMDGLARDWYMDSFMNPPYIDVESWIKKAHEQHWKHGIDILALVFSKTGVSWFHKYIYSNELKGYLPHVEVYPHKGRIRFLENGKPSHNVATDDSIWIVWSQKSLIKRRLGQT